MSEFQEGNNLEIAPVTLESALRLRIDHGIGLLQDRAGLDAYLHFQSSHGLAGMESVDVGIMSTFHLDKLLTDADVVYAAATVASQSSASLNGHSAQVGSWHTGDWVTFQLDDPKNYRPDLVETFYQEVGTVGAEEWLHLLQIHGGRPIAGIEDMEVDVAAYLHAQEIDLSLDFLTRYRARARWYADLYPEEEARLRAFGKQFGRLVMGTA